MNIDKVQGLGPQIYSIELRDLFAMAALGALMAPNSGFLVGRMEVEDAARMAYKCADAFLLERATSPAPAGTDRQAGLPAADNQPG